MFLVVNYETYMKGLIKSRELSTPFSSKTINYEASDCAFLLLCHNHAIRLIS